ncbi:hypothetical protein BU15DRAFT_68722 [Melanogaster broomeanus]|nr:hypothetical protein BU15DRAFT_68722 [Melanogaster broomeanus]
MSIRLQWSGVRTAATYRGGSTTETCICQTSWSAGGPSPTPIQGGHEANGSPLYVGRAPCGWHRSIDINAPLPPENDPGSNVLPLCISARAGGWCIEHFSCSWARAAVRLIPVSRGLSLDQLGGATLVVPKRPWKGRVLQCGKVQFNRARSQHIHTGGEEGSLKDQCSCLSLKTVLFRKSRNNRTRDDMSMYCNGERTKPVLCTKQLDNKTIIQQVQKKMVLFR